MIRLRREQVRRVDAIAIKEFAMPGVLLMENAAQSCVFWAERAVPQGVPRALVACGPGNNGGDGLAIARLLANRMYRVTILFTEPTQPYKGDAAVMARIGEAMRLPTTTDPTVIARQDWELIVDAIFGTGLTRAPRDVAKRAIELINAERRHAHVLAVDLPSGLDCDTGEPLGDACIRATMTVTFVAEKLGFANPQSRAFTGDVVVGDIGCPREAIERVSRS